VSKIIVKLKDPLESDKLNWPNLDELFELSHANEVFVEDPQTGELLQVLDLDKPPDKPESLEE